MVDFTPLSSKQIDISKIKKDLKTKTVSQASIIALINRRWIFPVILTIYLVYLLIQQTQIRELHLSSIYLIFPEQLLLFFTIVSGLFLVYHDEIDQLYEIETRSLYLAYAYRWLSAILWLLSTYIIYQQVEQLWTIWVVISLIAGILIFLVGVMLMEDDSSVIDSSSDLPHEL